LDFITHFKVDATEKVTRWKVRFLFFPTFAFLVGNKLTAYLSYCTKLKDTPAHLESNPTMNGWTECFLPEATYQANSCPSLPGYDPGTNIMNYMPYPCWSEM
jgi:hypothetical protein